MKKHLNDILLIGGVLAVGCILAAVLLLTRRSGASVEVRVDGKVVAELPLGEDTEYLIHGANGGTNRLVIRGGEAWVEEASCPDGLCVNMGHIHSSGRSIICLPNKVVVEIVGKGGSRDAPDLEVGK